ncbi:hypothetical protein [Streptomyces sp. A5-4]|uniref:hypothetical protein n=1 Tax=Streptomyces sp. A5-4 TaxID=3384771 RepID=UPI003DA8A2E5
MARQLWTTAHLRAGDLAENDVISTPDGWRLVTEVWLEEHEFEFYENYPDAKEEYGKYFHGSELHALLTLLRTDETGQMGEYFYPLGFLDLVPIQIPADTTKE